MISLDTNALVRMLIEDDEDQFQAVRKAISLVEKNSRSNSSSIRSPYGNDLGTGINLSVYQRRYFRIFGKADYHANLCLCRP